MSRKSLIQIAVALGVLAIVLIFLGVNYVPSISAVTSTGQNSKDTLSVRVNYSNEQYPRSIINTSIYAGSDWFERHPLVINQLVNNAGSDYYDRHPSNYYSNSDWIERHP
jgi:hypothetical protein